MLTILKTDVVLDVPREVAVCQFCDASLTVQFDWIEAKDGWKVERFAVECSSEPDIDGDEWPDWWAIHSQMPYVYWLPLDLKVCKWVNANYRFDLDQ